MREKTFGKNDYIKELMTLKECKKETELLRKALMKNNEQKWISEECHERYKQLIHEPTELQRTTYQFLNGKGKVAKDIFRDEMTKLGFNYVDIIGELLDDPNIVLRKDSIALKKDIQK